MRRITFKKHFLKITLTLIRSSFNRSLNIVLGHIDRLGILDHRTESGIGIRVRASLFTAITMSFPIRVKALDIAAHRFNFLAFLNSNALPIV